MPNQVGLARVDNLVVSNMVLEVLHYADALVKVVLGVTEDELANVLPFVGALPDDLAVVLEQVSNEEPVEVLRRRVRVLINRPR